MAGDVDLTVLTLLCLHDVQRGQRNFKAALATLGALLDYLGDKPGSRGRRLEVTQAMASLLLKMRDTRRAAALLEGLLSTPEIGADPSLLARTWNTMGLVHRRSTAPAARSTPSGRRWRCWRRPASGSGRCRCTTTSARCMPNAPIGTRRTRASRRR